MMGEQEEQEQHSHEDAVRSITTRTEIPPNLSEYGSYGGSKLAAFVYDLIQQTQAVMENMLPLINDIDAGAVRITEEVQRCRDSSLDRKAKLEQERERFQQAASSVLHMLDESSGSGSALALQIEAPREEESQERES